MMDASRKLEMKSILNTVGVGLTIFMAAIMPVSAIYVTVTDLGSLAANASWAGGINDAGQMLGTLYFQSTASDHVFFWDSGTMTDLGTLGGSSSFPASSRKSINKFGQAVGYSDIASGFQHAFLWQKGTGMTDLGTLRGSNSYAVGINDSGQIAGTSSDASGLNHAVMWQNGAIMDLGALAAGCNSGATAINNAGQVVGWSEVSPGGAQHAFFWNGTMTDLGALSGNDYSYPVDINDTAQVVGNSFSSTRYAGVFTNYHGFIWQSGAMTSLGSLGGDTTVAAISSSGQVTGLSYYSAANYHAFLWQGGQMTDLGTLGGLYSSAFEINDSGQIVGFANDASGNVHPFVWQSGAMTTLPDLAGGSAHNPLSINNAGQAAGSSISTGGSVHAVLWTILPQPPTFTITASASSGGSISPPGNTTVTIGTNQTYFITASPFYHIADVQVDGASVGPISTYTFNNVTANRTISATFVLVNIEVTSPNGGELWQRGTDRTITWSYINNPGNIVRIELLNNAGAVVDIINNGVPIGKDGFGSYKWHIPLKLAPTSYLVRITSTTNGAFWDASDNYFGVAE